MTARATTPEEARHPASRSAGSRLVSPWDRHNQKLVSNVHPQDWVNPNPAPRYNLVVIGGGDLYNRTRLTPLVKGLFKKWLVWSR